MLAKQVWNLLQHPESITFRILKARYFPRGDLIEVENGYRPSFMWRSLMAARDLVKEGLAWRIGDGQKVKIAGDRWIGVEEPHSPSEVFLDVIKAGKVEMLIDKDTGKWDEILIGNSFPPSEAKQIIAILLSANPQEDRQIWRLTKHGFFSVKTAYHLAVSKYSSIHASRSSTSSPPIEWKKIWHIRVIPRVRMLLWKICAEILPTKLNLCKRGCRTDPICVLCGEEHESVDHLFMQCKVVVKLWYVSSLRIDMSHEMHDQFKSFIWHRVASYPKEYVELLAITAWEIWKGRNHACFDNVPFDIQGTINKAYRQWSYLTDTKECCSVSEKPRQLFKRWRKSEQGKYKLNCDVAVSGNGKIGMGFVLRNEQSSVMLAGKGEMKAEGASTLLKSMAIRYGMQKVKQYRLRADTVEGDSKMCMDGLNGISTPDIYCDVTFRDIKELAMEIGCDNFTFVPRDGNATAHAAAQGVNFLSYKQCPHHIKGHIDRDVMV